MESTLSIVIPVKNEREEIGPLIRQIRQEVGPSAELILVDDGSTDGSGALAAQAGAKVLTQPCGIGNGAAVKRGIREASGEWILLMDGDGQHDPEDIPRILALADRYDMVVGARSLAGQAGIGRAIANGIYNRLASYVTEQKVQDLTSGFRLFRKADVLPFLPLLPNQFSYPATLTLAFLRSGHSVGFVPITAHRRVGRSKLNLWRDGVRFLLIILKIATLYAPLRIFLPVSIGFFGLGVGYYAYTFWTAHRFTNMAALLMTTGVLVFLMGLIAESIAELRFQRSRVG